MPAPAAATVAIAKAASHDHKLVRQQVRAALDALGGAHDIIPSGANVVMKVNLTGGTSCRLEHDVACIESHWTHPEVVWALGQPLRDAGAQKLYIVEGLAMAAIRLCMLALVAAQIPSRVYYA